MKITRAMLLAAGLGMRMRPLTEDTAKPLLPLGGRTLLDHALDRLLAEGVETVVVNVHWQAERVVAHLQSRAAGPAIVVQREATLLETGGAIQTALPQFGDAPFFVVNADSFWLDGPTRALARLAGAWDAATADGVLLVHRTFQVQADIGAGDFALDTWGLLRRRREREIVPYVYAGIQVIDARMLAHATAARAPFSVNRLWDDAMARGRLRGLVHDGLWFHLSTPPDLEEAEHTLHVRPLGETR